MTGTNACAAKAMDSATAPNDLRHLRQRDWQPMKARPLPCAELLNSLFRYDQETGFLHWRPRPGDKRFNSLYAGKATGTKRTRGHVQVVVGKQNFSAHRVIWKMVHGKDPQEIDHINGVTWDNRIANLRDVDRSGNLKNIRRRPTSGCTGVFYSKTQNRWVSQIRVDLKAKHLGTFLTKEEAVAARKGAERALGYYDY